jgi:hypothetical protein
MKKKFIGCNEDCFNCQYPDDCHKPSSKCKPDKAMRAAHKTLSRNSESQSRMFTIELGGFGGSMPNISRKFYI